MTEERRSEPRIDAGSLHLVAHDSLTGEPLGSVVNLSSNGLMLNTTQRADPDGVMQLDLRRLAQPELPILEMAVRIGWVFPADTPDNYWLGAQIIGIGEAHAQTLRCLIEEAETA